MRRILVLSAVASTLSLLISVISLWLGFGGNLFLSLVLSFLYGLLTGIGVAIAYIEYTAMGDAVSPGRLYRQLAAVLSMADSRSPDPSAHHQPLDELPPIWAYDRDRPIPPPDSSDSGI